MQTISFRSHVGTDGLLHLEVPSTYTDADVDVTVTVRPIDLSAADSRATENWPPGFFEDVIGAWKGEPLVREYAGGYESRDEL